MPDTPQVFDVINETLAYPSPSRAVLWVNRCLMAWGLAMTLGMLCAFWRETLVSYVGGMILSMPCLCLAGSAYATIYHTRPWIVSSTALQALLPCALFAATVAGLSDRTLSLVIAFAEVVDDRSVWPISLVLAMLSVGIAISSFALNWRWASKLDDWEQSCVRQGLWSRIRGSRRGAWRLSLREVLGAMLVMSLLLGLARLITAPLSPRYFQVARVEDAPFPLPADAREIEYSLQVDRRLPEAMLLQFSCSEDSFRRSHPEAIVRAATPGDPIFAGDVTGGVRWVTNGLEYFFEDTRVVFDADTGRVFCAKFRGEILRYSTSE